MTTLFQAISVLIVTLLIGCGSRHSGDIKINKTATLVDTPRSFVKNMATLTDSIEIPSLQFDGKGKLITEPSPTSSPNDFDFYVGKWTVKNKKLKSRFNNCTEWLDFDTTVKMFKVLNGFGNIDNIYANFDGKPFEGMSVRFFKPETKLWSIHWADTNTLAIDKPTVGSFDKDFGHFFTQDTINEQKLIVVYRWDISDKNKPVWSQAFSADNGKTWEWNWYMYFTKADE